MEAKEKLTCQTLQEHIAKALREARHKRKLSQDQAGIQSGVYRTKISNIERGQTAGTLYTLVRLCKFYGLSLDKLCGLSQ